MVNKLFLKLFLVFFCFVPLVLCAQNKGYRIECQLPDVKGFAYLLECGPEKLYLVDSVKIRKGKAVFSGSESLSKCGYWIHFPTGGYPLVIENDAQFTLKIGGDGFIQVEGSEENQVYLNYQNQSAAVYGDSTLTYEQKVEKMRTYADAISSVNQNSLVSKYIQFETVANAISFSPDYHNLPKYRTLFLQLMSPFQDSIYVRNILWQPLLESYFARPIAKADYDRFFQVYPASQYVGAYYLVTELLRNAYDLDAAAGDALVYLYDTYYGSDGALRLSTEMETRLQKIVERKRRVQIGAKIPTMEVRAENGKTLSTNDITRKYTVLWFWDPDCEDCQVETPDLHRFYLEAADTYDFEVFAVSITDDVSYWKSKVNEWQLSWLNSCYGLGGYNYDFVDYLSLIATPVSFLLDNDGRVVYRNFTPEQLKEYFENTDKE